MLEDICVILIQENVRNTRESWKFRH